MGEVSTKFRRSGVIAAGRGHRVDLLVEFQGRLVAIEVKSGGGVRTAQQLAKDHLMASQGGMLVSRKLPESLRYRTFLIETVEIILP